jgi:hypothetical protein
VAVRDRGLAKLSTARPFATGSYAFLILIFVALATLHTWPMPSNPAHLTRLDNDDTAFNTWVIAWVQHQLTHDP